MKLGFSGLNSHEKNSLHTESHHVRENTLVFKWSTGIPWKFGRGSFISGDTRRFEPPVDSVVCLVN